MILLALFYHLQHFHIRLVIVVIKNKSFTDSNNYHCLPLLISQKVNIHPTKSVILLDIHDCLDLQELSTAIDSRQTVMMCKSLKPSPQHHIIVYFLAILYNSDMFNQNLALSSD